MNILKRFTILFFAIIIGCLVAEAQISTKENQGINISLLGVEYFYEQPIAKRLTLVYRAGFVNELGYSWSSLILNDESLFKENIWSYALRVKVGVDARYYYNLLKRFKKGKNIRKNSGGYLGISGHYYTPGLIKKNLETNSLLLLYPHWGFKRVYRHNWFIDFNAGYAFIWWNGYSGNGLNYSFSFGLAF